MVKRFAWAIGNNARRRGLACARRHGRAGRVDRQEIVLADSRPGTAELAERAEALERRIELLGELKPDERATLILIGLGVELRGDRPSCAAGARRRSSAARPRGAPGCGSWSRRGGENMTLRTLGGMEVLRPIEFTEALAWFQGRIGGEVRVVVNHHGHFFGCGMQGTLSRVETLPPDNSAIRVVVGVGEGLFLDPEDVTALLGGRCELARAGSSSGRPSARS